MSNQTAFYADLDTEIGKRCREAGISFTMVQPQYTRRNRLVTYIVHRGSADLMDSIVDESNKKILHEWIERKPQGSAIQSH